MGTKRVNDSLSFRGTGFQPVPNGARRARVIEELCTSARVENPCYGDRIFNITSRAVLMCVVMLIAGCGKPAGLIFPPVANAPHWPAAPQPKRIVYVGQLTSSADLKPAVPWTKRFGQALFGKKAVQSMLTPYALCTDGKDRLYVADSNAQVVHVFDMQSRTYWKIFPAEQPNHFSQPVGIAYDPAGRLFVSDSVAACVYVFDSSGKQLGTIGQQTLRRPCGLAYDPRTQRLFVADAGLHRVVVLSRSGEEIASIGGRGAKLGEFNFPTNVTIDSKGRLYVSDSLNFRVQEFGPDLQPIRQIGKKGDMPGYFSQPKGVSVDSEDHLYAVDANFEAVQIFNSEGALLMDFGQEGRGPGEFWLPSGIFIDPHNRIWVADGYNRRVQVFDYVPEAKP